MNPNTTPAAAVVTPTGCCPPVDPSLWHEKEIVWHDHPFVKTHVRALFHVPIGLGKKVTEAKEKIDAAGAAPAAQLMLSDESSPWGSDLYIDVSKPVSGAEMATLSGRFLCRVYDGPFNLEGRWAAEMKRYVEAKGQRLDKLYFGYTTCPNCAKAYGHNYVVVFAKVGGATS